MEEKVLVGTVPRLSKYEAHMKHRFYHIPVRQLKNGWQEAKYIALYLTRGVTEQNGITYICEIADVTISFDDDQGKVYLSKESLSDSQQQAYDIRLIKENPSRLFKRLLKLV